MSKHYHFIGIGGIGMSGIAHLLLACGNRVTGSDIKENKIILELRRLGADICIGHKAGNVCGADIVVYSSAIKGDNPEIAQAKKLNIPLLMRAQALAELMRDKAVIAVAGSHGKTTTASLVSCLLMEAGLSPTAAVGGVLKNIDTNACMGSGKFFVAEADESDGSFLYYRPKFSIITNIDREHLDHYGNFDNEVDAFRKFIGLTDKEGCVFCCSDDANLPRLAKDSAMRHLFFGLTPAADIYPQNLFFDGLTCAFDCIFQGKLVARFNLSLGGRHNISNALAVIALGLELGIEIRHIKKALADFKGAGRRLEVKFKSQDYYILDDYAHHPTEIAATLNAAKSIKAKRTVVLFQPHRYTRTQLLFDDFVKSFKDAECLIITDIYPASEEPIPGVSGKALYDKIKKDYPGKEVYFMAKEEIAEKVVSLAESGDLIITLGAGDISKISDELAKRFETKT
jgi:UDP-N-acetylmuramate--alanine ligase